jgi:hypothetical protein
MTTTTNPTPTRPAGVPLLLDEHPRRLGPVSRRLLTRLVVVLAVVEVVGTVLVFAVDGDAARAAGLSLVFPGAGLLYDALPLAFVATLGLLVVALVLWWGVSAHLAIPVVWMASVGAAALLADGPRLWVDDGTHWWVAVPVAYLLAAGFAGWGIWRVERRFREKRARIPELNAYLRDVILPEPITTPRQPDRMDAELLRWCYSFALQPDDGLVGMDWGEQFHGGTQLRYQLNAIAWAMSLYAANFLPNAPGHITHALVKAIDKHTDLRVWRYWHTLNLLGNFDPNPDPIRRDNIMFSAFLGDVLNTFEAATGSDHFDRPGSLTFVWKDGRTFPYDHDSIAAAVRRNYDRSRLGFFPCEPGWSFTVCNVMGAQALRNHDARHGTDDWAAVKEGWRRTLDEEYSTPDGSYAHIRSNLVGLSWDTGEVPGGHYFANGTHRFADILPDHADRARALDLKGAQAGIGALAAMVRHSGGTLELQLPDELERHRTASSALLPWIKLIGGARLCGEPELVEAAIAASARQCATGERWPKRPVAVGGSGFGSYLIVRWSQPLDLARLNLRGFVAPQGPVLAGHDADAVLVTLARSPDGVGLDLALEPLDEAIAETSLSFSQLAPVGRYRLRSEGTEQTVTASTEGTATVTLDAVTGPTTWALEPIR